MTIFFFFLSEMWRARKHLVIQTAGVWLWSTSERQTLRYRASLSRAHWIPHSGDASDRTQLPGAAQWEPVAPVFTANAEAKIKTKTKFRERNQILSGEQLRKIPSPSVWFSTSDLGLLRSARAPLPGGRASGGQSNSEFDDIFISLWIREMLLIHESAATAGSGGAPGRTSIRLNQFSSGPFAVTLELYSSGLMLVSFFPCECVVQVYPQVAIQGSPPHPPTPRRVHISSAAFLDKISQQTARPNRWTTASAFQRRLSGDIVHNTVNNSRKSISHNPAESVYQKKKERS